MTLWSRAPNLAVVDSDHRRVVLVLDRPTQAPVVLEGAALEIFDTIDCSRRTEDIVSTLEAQHPEGIAIAHQVLRCLGQLAAMGIIAPIDRKVRGPRLAPREPAKRRLFP